MDMSQPQGFTPTADGCFDCGRPYGNEHGFPDLIVSNDIWRRISPSGGDGGLLCPSCIVKRVAALGCREIPAAFMSGPLKSVDPDLMHTMRWVENLKEQGHGWYCPECNGPREQCDSLPAGESLALCAAGATAGA